MIAERIDLERVRAEANRINVGRALLTLLVGVFWLLGWLVGQLFNGVTFAGAAVKVGWQDARGAARRGGMQ